jgi:DNA-binding NtrC family response regulator
MYSKSKINILLIEDEEFDVRRVKNTLKPIENNIHIKAVVASGHAALEILNNNKTGIDVIIMDFQIAGGLTGENLIREIKKIDNTIQIIVATKMTINITDYEFANRLLEAGAMWYCTKYPGDIEEYIYQPTDFVLSIYNAYEKRILEKARLKSDDKLKENIQDILNKNPLIGNADSMENLRVEIQRCTQTDTNVLIQGHSGTGKELVAKHIHYNSPRKYEKFVPINCGSLPQELIESELFGFEKGAFTGAITQKQGLFEVANNGTVFLDEVAELPKNAQVKLLRVIQEGEIDKIGRTNKIKVNVRIIAATNKNLREELREKHFREDLFYRLNVVSINVPALIERKSDIPSLVKHYMDFYSHDMSRESPEIEDAAMKMLQQFEWPGNVRQMQNVIQRLLFAGSKSITEEDINNALGISKPHSQSLSISDTLLWNTDEILPWRQMESKIRKEYFKFVRQNSGSDSDAAKKLGLAPPNYYRMCKELGLK